MDLLYKIKLWIGFKFLGWHKPKNYDYGYFIDKTTVVMKRRIENWLDGTWKIETIMKIFSDKGIDWWKNS